MPDPTKLIATIGRAARASRATAGRVGAIVELPGTASDVLVAGDLHGHLHVAAALLKRADLDRNPGRHLVLQEPTHDTRIDPDEGELDRSHRLIDVIAALKCQYPDRVHLILGNHELSELTGRSILKRGHPLNRLFRQGVEASYGPHAEAVIAAYHDLFRSLPLAVRTPNRGLLCHTVPEAKDLDGLDLEVLRTGAWAEADTRRGSTVYALTWGRDQTPETAERFAALMGVDWCIAGHEACERGYLRANDRLLILDGRDPYPAYTLFPVDRPLTMDDLVAATTILPGDAGDGPGRGA